MPGVTFVSGTVTSFGSETDNVIIHLIAEGYSEADYEVIVQGNTATYSIGGVAAGTYTLKVTKAGHQTFEGKIVVSVSDVVRNVTLSLVPNEEALIGDVNLDGQVNAMDANIMKRIISGTITPTDYQNLAGDVNGDGQINGLDSNLLSRIVSGAN